MERAKPGASAWGSGAGWRSRMKLRVERPRLRGQDSEVPTPAYATLQDKWVDKRAHAGAAIECRLDARLQKVIREMAATVGVSKSTVRY